jgi:hypothetical protein
MNYFLLYAINQQGIRLERKTPFIKPMVNKYLNKMQSEKTVQIANPSAAVIQQILNYSKSLEVKKIKHKKVLVHLN